MKPLRAVLDTNVIVSTLLFRSGRLAWLRDAWTRGEVVPVVSAQTLSEFVRVLAYPRFKLPDEERKTALTHYMEYAEAINHVNTRAKLPVCRDPDDVIFLRLAYAAKVDMLVSGDADLLALAGQSRIPILPPDALRDLLRQGGA